LNGELGKQMTARHGSSLASSILLRNNRAHILLDLGEFHELTRDMETEITDESWGWNMGRNRR
jgi:hypothetical protein